MVAAALLWTFSLVVPAPDLRAQPVPDSYVAEFATRERHVRSGEYRRSLLSDVEQGHSWASSDRLTRSEGAIYAGLRELALRELEEVLSDAINRETEALTELRMGRTEIAAGNYANARAHLNAAITTTTSQRPNPELDRTSGEALYWIGVANLMESANSGYDDAARAFIGSARDYPANVRADDAFYFLGQLEEARGDFAEALARYRELLEKHPDSEYALATAVRRTQLLTVLHRWDEAGQSLERAEKVWTGMKEDPDAVPQRFSEQLDLELLLLRGEISAGKGDLPGAERAYLALVYMFEEGYRRDGMLGLGDTYLAAGRVDSAVAVYGRILDEGSTDRPGMKAEYFRAIALLNGGTGVEEEIEEARRSLKTIASDSAHLMVDQARLALSDLAYRDGDYSQAAALARGATTKSVSGRVRARAEVLLGASLMMIEEYSKAADAFEDAAVFAAATPEIEMPERDAVVELASRLQPFALFYADEHAEAIAAFESYLAAGYDTSRVAEMSYWLGETYHAAGMTSEATRTLEELVERYPTSPYTQQALYTIGWTHFRARDFVAAEGAFGRLVKAFPLSNMATESQIRRGDCLYLRKEFAKAAQMYAQVAAMGGTPLERQYADYQRGLALYQSGDTLSSRREFALFVANNAASTWADDALFMTGLIDYRSSQYDESIAIMRRLLESYPESRLHARAYYSIGDAYYRMRKFDDALAAYSIVTDRYPQSSYRPDAESGIVFAKAMIQREEDREQTGMVQVADITGRPTYEIELRRAQIYLDANKISEAIAEYDAFVLKNPESPNLATGYLGIAEARLKTGDTAAAIDTLEMIALRFTEGTSVPPAILLLADLHMIRNDTSAALMALAELRENFGGTAAAPTGLVREAELLLATGHPAEAKRVLREGVALLDSVSGHRTRTGGRILSMLAELESEEGEHTEARSRWTLLSERDDSIAGWALLNIALSFSGEGDEASAIVAFGELLDRFSGDPILRAEGELGLASSFEKTNQANKAIEIYESLIDRHGDDRFAVEAGRRLEELVGE